MASLCPTQKTDEKIMTPVSGSETVTANVVKVIALMCCGCNCKCSKSHNDGTNSSFGFYALTVTLQLIPWLKPMPCDPRKPHPSMVVANLIIV